MSVRLRIGQADGAGVVDADIDAAEFGDGLLDRRDHLRLVADVAQHRQRLAAGGADFLRRGVDGALELRMRLRGLGRDRDIGAVTRGAQRDRQPDAAAGAGDEQRLAFERCHWARSRFQFRLAMIYTAKSNVSRHRFTAPPLLRRACADRARRAGRSA